MEIKDFDTQLTSRAFFMKFEEVYLACDNMEEAYEKLTDMCFEQRITITYSSFASFQTSYYRFIRARKKKYKTMFSQEK